MSIVSLIKAGLTAIGINFDSFMEKAIESFNQNPPAVRPSESGHKLTPIRGRVRQANSNAAKRRYDGIPHGTSGAKLARRAAQGRVTLRGTDTATFAS